MRIFRSVPTRCSSDLSLLVVGTVVWYVFKEQAESQLRSELSVHLNQLSAALEWQEAADDVDAEGAEDGLFLASQVQLSRSEEHTSELQSRGDLVCCLL